MSFGPMLDFLKIEQPDWKNPIALPAFAAAATRSQKQCRFCGAPLSLLRRIAGTAYCSPDHEQLERRRKPKPWQDCWRKPTSVTLPYTKSRSNFRCRHASRL